MNNVGPRARSFTLNIAADLRIVNTENLLVAHTVSLQKQVTGFEIDTDVFRFFGNRLFDINLGTRNLEPIQLAVRTVLELGVLELVSQVSGVGLDGCLEDAVAAGLVSEAYTPPASPLSAPPPPPSAEVPSPPTAATPAAADATRSVPPTPPRRPVVEGSRPAATAAQPTLRRPDAEMRPPIPAWMEQPGGGGTGQTAPGSLFAPNPNQPGGNGRSEHPPAGRRLNILGAHEPRQDLAPGGGDEGAVRLAAR